MLLITFWKLQVLIVEFKLTLEQFDIILGDTCTVRLHRIPEYVRYFVAHNRSAATIVEAIVIIIVWFEEETGGC